MPRTVEDLTLEIIHLPSFLDMKVLTTEAQVLLSTGFLRDRAIDKPEIEKLEMSCFLWWLVLHCIIMAELYI